MFKILKEKIKQIYFGKFLSRSFPGDDIYTSLSDASKQIKERWSDDGLKEKVEKYLGGDIPDFLKEKPYIVLFRNIATPNNEISILIDFAIKAKIDFAILEFTKDKFVPINKDKKILLFPHIYMGKSNHGKDRIFKIQIADINTSQGKSFTDIKTNWGQSLVDFHHDILEHCYVGTKEKVFDLSYWLERHGGRARDYYKQFLALLIRNCILVECFSSTKEEVYFFDSVFKPAFDGVKKEFGMKPLVVRLSSSDPSIDKIWWYYRDSVKDILDNYILRVKNNY